MLENVVEYTKHIIIPAIKNSQLAYDLIDEIIDRCQFEYVIPSDKGCEICVLTALYVTHTAKYQDNLKEAKHFDTELSPEELWAKTDYENVYYMNESGGWQHIARLIVNLNDYENLMAEEIAYEIEKLTENPELLSWDDHQFDQ